MELTPMQEVIVNTVIPISVLIIMFSMGMSLRLGDFARVFTAPKPFLIAVIGQYVFVPVLAIAAVWLLGVSPAIAIGAIIVASIPGGTVSNAFVYAGRGNSALSISLTAVSQFVGLVTIPLYITWALTTYDAGVSVESFPVWESIRLVLFVSIVPMGLGMLFLRFMTATAERIEPFMRKFSAFLIFAIVFVVIWPNYGPALEHATTAGLLALVVCVGGYLFGSYASKTLGLSRRDAFTNGVEIGIQNLSVAVLIGGTILGRPDLLIYVLVYSVVSPLVMSVAAYLHARSAEPEAETA